MLTIPGNRNKARGASAWLKAAKSNNVPASAANYSNGNGNGNSSSGTSVGKAETKKDRQRGHYHRTMAELANKHQLHQQAVQNPQKKVRDLDSIYHAPRSRYTDH
ncbi:hypothetical protein GGI25_004434 [Coemansia spiralis]|uniref:Uncharacterized protein n=1 Tax=Coemansia spiralis TaxID=417178 RepID=A0A9W8G4W2_9FUNG|nr:hypothetical protein GGI25_004434 [Coemansia spiralis]